MPWVRFLDVFDWNVPGYSGNCSIHYKAGRAYFVKQACAEEAIAKGRAERTVNPKRKKPDAQGTD